MGKSGNIDHAIVNVNLQWKVKGDGCVALCLFLIFGRNDRNINKIKQ